jgi:hypothetical protein
MGESSEVHPCGDLDGTSHCEGKCRAGVRYNMKSDCDSPYIYIYSKVKLSLYQAMEAHGVVRR